MIKAIFFDVDGTLRDFTEQGVRPSTRLAIQKAQDAGVRCFVATGRHMLEIERDNLTGGIPFDGYVLQNGNYCLSGDRKTVLYSNPIPASQIRILLNLGKQYDFPIIFMESDAIYTTGVTPRMEKSQAAIGTSVPAVETDQNRPLLHPIYLATPFAEPAVLDRVIKSLPLCSVLWWPVGDAFDLIAKDSSKDRGIRKVMEHFALTRDEIAAVGDGENDVAMLRFAGTGIAMGGSDPRALAAADYITASIHEDGLLRAVEYLLSLRV